MNVAIVHDYLNQRGGAERVVAVLHEMFPDAPIYTAIVDRALLLPELKGADIRPSWMNGVPLVNRHFKAYFMLYPRVMESFNLEGYDLIISSSSAYAKAAVKAPGALHVCYCYTPMRFAWDFEGYVEKERMNPLLKAVLPYFMERLRRWDLATSGRPDYYVAISAVIQRRIKAFYNRDSDVIFPPVETGRFSPSAETDDYYLIVSRLNAYKRVDLAIEAFNKLKRPLKVAGEGPQAGRLKAIAGPTIEFMDRVDDKTLSRLYSRCRAFIFPGEEDFGLTPIEANSAGRPVIAYHGGGALDTVEEGISGVFFREKTADALINAVNALERDFQRFNTDEIRAHALRFDKEVFKRRFLEFVTEKYEAHRLGAGRRAAV